MVTALKKLDSLSPTRYQLSIGPQLGEEPPLYTGILIDLILCGFSDGDHRRCEFMNSRDLWCPEDSP